jgi:sigma-E factor negative regulatory protein RseA
MTQNRGISMKQPVRESISALLDDEANELDLQRILKELEGDADSAGTWQRYHLQSATLRNELGSFSHMDISSRVRESINDEFADASLAPAPRKALGAWVKPFTSVAVAASVTAAILTSTQLYNAVAGGGAPTEAALAVSGNVSAVMANSQTVGFGNAAPRTSASMAVAPRDQSVADEMARQRLDHYLRNNVGNASLNTSSGLMPFARTNLLQED